MELAFFALVLAGVVLVVSREIDQPFRRYRRAPTAVTVAVLSGLFVATTILAAGDADEDQATSRAEAKPAVKKLVKPKGWPAGHPLPLVGSNCAACHLTAGRELTQAVDHFVRGVHDLQEMTLTPINCQSGSGVFEKIRLKPRELGE